MIATASGPPFGRGVLISGQIAPRYRHLTKPSAIASSGNPGVPDRVLSFCSVRSLENRDLGPRQTSLQPHKSPLRLESEESTAGGSALFAPVSTLGFRQCYKPSFRPPCRPSVRTLCQAPENYQFFNHNSLNHVLYFWRSRPQSTRIGASALVCGWVFAITIVSRVVGLNSWFLGGLRLFCRRLWSPSAGARGFQRPARSAIRSRGTRLRPSDLWVWLMGLQAFPMRW